jgi:hypothetical protein
MTARRSTARLDFQFLSHHGIGLADNCGLSRSASDAFEKEWGTTFEGWSLMGDAGDVIMLPMQIEL